MRPGSIAEVAELSWNDDQFDLWLPNFLDEFYAAPHAARLEAAPRLLAPRFGERGQIQDAYLAATAVELARARGLPCPAWTGQEERKLHRPWFASTMASLRAVLILESPPAFRERNLFVSANALSRA